MTAEEELNKKWEMRSIMEELIKSAHSNPSPQTLAMFEKQDKTMEKGFDEIKKSLKENTEKTELVLLQATKTNGRVTATEEWSKSAQKIIEHNTEVVEELKANLSLINERHAGDKRQVIVAVSIATFFLATIGGLGYKVIQQGLDKQIQSSVAESLLEMAEKVEKAK